MDKYVEQSVAALELLLQRMVSLHQELLTIMQRKRDAMRRGNARLMADLCSLENQKVQAISDLEKKRLELVAQLTLRIKPAATEPMHMAALADRLPEPLRGRVLVLRQQLREQMLAVKEQTSVARRAADSLMRHVQGLMQSVTAASAGAATYSRRGIIPQPTSGMATFSMKA